MLRIDRENPEEQEEINPENPKHLIISNQQETGEISETAPLENIHTDQPSEQSQELPARDNN